MLSGNYSHPSEPEANQNLTIPSESPSLSSSPHQSTKIPSRFTPKREQTIHLESFNDLLKKRTETFRWKFGGFYVKSNHSL